MYLHAAIKVLRSKGITVFTNEVIVRVKSKWNAKDRVRTLDEIGGATAFILWRIAQQGLLNLENEGFQTDTREQRIDVITEFLAFLVHLTDRMKAEALEENDNKILVRFEVRDTGMGLDPEVLNGLFQVFEQADATTTRKHGGTGLGLAITRRIAQLMGGEIGAESVPGQGSRFWFTAWLERGQESLPITISPSGGSAEARLRTHHAGSRILLVEDNAINCEVAVALLSSAYMAVDIAVDGFQAVSMVANKVYDLVLMDMRMPVMDGLQATRVIRSMTGSMTHSGVSYAQLPILAMTANVFQDDREACLEAGMQDFVAKPVVPEDLFLMLIKWLPTVAMAEPFEASTLPVLAVTEVNNAVHQDTDCDAVSPLDTSALADIYGDDVAARHDILQKFAVQVEQVVTDFELAYRQRDTDKITFHTHKLKSSSRTVGANVLADLSCAIELAGKHSDWAEIDRLAKEMRPAAELTKACISEL